MQVHKFISKKKNILNIQKYSRNILIIHFPIYKLANYFER